MLDVIRKGVYGQATAYTRILDAAEKLKKALPDEGMRLRAAVASAGVTAAEVHDAVIRHQQALQTVRSQFASDTAAQRAQKIDAKRDRRTQIVNRLRELESELASLRTEDATLQQQLGAHEALFSQAQADFDATAASVEQELAGVGTRLEQLIVELGA
jgi:predicted  nucleic acid-binding Zn-ribbon protein